MGFICSRPLDDPNHLSGMPFHMARALRGQGIEIVELCEHPRTPEKPPLPARVIRRARREWKRRTPPAWRRFLDDAMPKATRQRLLASVRRRSENMQSQLDTLTAQGVRLDAVFGCCISSVLYELRTQIPIVYFSDATSYLICGTYRGLKERGQEHIESLHHVEHISTARARIAAYASPAAHGSAINDLSIPADRARVVPMGANVTPDDPASITAPASPPTRDDCQLLIVAADPVRKRVDLAVEAAECLRARGINTTLHIVGPGTKRSNTSPAAKPHGRLKLSDARARAIHRQLLRDCHLQLLPSLGEAFGIAPVESAHFARPSIVSGVGGLPFVVQHDQTGIVIDRDASASAWADAVESLIDNATRYQAMSTAALERARSELNWDAWGRSVAGIILQAIAHPARD